MFLLTHLHLYPPTVLLHLCWQPYDSKVLNTYVYMIVCLRDLVSTHTDTLLEYHYTGSDIHGTILYTYVYMIACLWDIVYTHCHINLHRIPPRVVLHWSWYPCDNKILYTYVYIIVSLWDIVCIHCHIYTDTLIVYCYIGVDNRVTTKYYILTYTWSPVCEILSVCIVIFTPMPS